MAAARRLTHLDPDGSPRMVDVSAKKTTRRVARATAYVALQPATIRALQTGGVPKGDPLATARLAGILAAKRVPELIPLCHSIRLDAVLVDAVLDEGGVRITTEARARDVTGVEMEALSAAAVAALTVYDMVKALDRGARIDDLRVTHKAGGRSGTWTAPERHDRGQSGR